MVPLAPDTVFARDFKVVRALASGGMGSVYEVEQLSTSKTRALKVLHGQLAGDPKIRQRFEQEARVGARIESDHVVDVVAAGVEEPDGPAWLVMEFLKGEDLAAHLERRGPLPPGEVLEIFRQMGHALAAAHRAGLVHRDLKPENVFLAESRREGAPFTVKVLDFGIAKALADAPGRTTQAMGTPYWMAPEQCESSRVIQPATDVWALGLIAYSLLTGACYWRSAAKAEPSVAGVILEMTSAPLDPPSARAREYGRDHLLPPGFDAWFLRCVARPVEHRFRDAAECVAALTAVLAPVAVVHPPTLPAGAFSSPMFGTPAAAAQPPLAPAVTAVPAPAMPPPPMAPPSMPQPSMPQPSPPAAHPATPWPVQAPAPAAPPEQRALSWVVIASVACFGLVCAAAPLAFRVYRQWRRVQPPEASAGVATPSLPGPMPLPQPAQGPLAVPPLRRDPPRNVMLSSAVTVVAGRPTATPAPRLVSQLLSAHSSQVRFCLRETAQREGLPMMDSLPVTLRVAQGGGVEDVDVKAIPSTSAAQCVRNALRMVVFASDGGGDYQAVYAVIW